MHAKKYELYSWENLNEGILEGKRLYLFGAGSRCNDRIVILQAAYNIAGIIDNDIAKRGQIISGVHVSGFEEMIDELQDAIILIMPFLSGKIAAQLEENGIENYYSDYYLSCGKDELYNLVRKDNIYYQDEIDRVSDLLCDEKSKSILNEIIEKRRMGILDHSDLIDGTEEYFGLDIFERDTEEVFVDVGAYVGDSIEGFIKWNNDFKKIIAFEPDNANYKKLEQSFIYQAFKWKIDIYPCGCADKEKDVYFDMGKGVSSRITDVENGVKIRCLSLDEFIKERVTFIKMDIEGAELDALKGASRLITEYKPKLAICIYHKLDDIYKIPLYIHELVPEYKFYIRHYSIHYTDTILYCCV